MENVRDEIEHVLDECSEAKLETILKVLNILVDPSKEEIKHKDVVLDPNVQVFVKDKSFYCECGCNVFSKLDRDGMQVFRCNACGQLYGGNK